MVGKTRRAAIASACLLACLTGSAVVGVSAVTARGAADHVEGTEMSETFQKAIDTLSPSQGEKEALRRAVATGRIDTADYEAAHSRYAQCMTTRGFAPAFRKSSGGFYVELPYLAVKDAAALDDATLECSMDTRVLEALYRLQQANPNLVTDSRLVAVQCLKREGAVGADYAAEEFQRDWSTHEFPFDPDHAAYNDCLYGAGYAYFTVNE